MKALIFGAGKQAEGCAWYLANKSDFETIGIASRTEATIDRLMEFIDSDKLVKHVVDVTDRVKTRAIMEKYDVGINALPTRKTSYTTLEIAIDLGIDMVDMIEEYHRRPDLYEKEGLEVSEGMSVEEYGELLHKRAIETGITIVDGMGFAPGLTNITLGKALRDMDKSVSAIARCGGIPDKKAAQRHPLKYMITWAFDHVLREYMIKSSALIEGELKEIQALSKHEKFRFDKLGVDEELECAVTPGMPSFVYTRPELQETYEKTVRWPGHYDGIKTLKECGMLDTLPATVGDKQVIPREVLAAVITPKLKPKEGDTDVCVMWNTAKGEKNGEEIRYDYYMWDREDTDTGLTAMQRTTGFPPAIAAELLANGKIPEKGIAAPEDCIKGSNYQEMLERLEDVGIEILEKIN